MNELVKHNNEEEDIGTGTTTEISWTPPADMTYEEWERMGYTLQQVGRSLNWWLGDWLNQGELRWGEMYSQALSITGLALETLSKYKNVAERVPVEIRLPQLTWSHHFAVAYKKPDHVRGPMLRIAAHYGIASRDLKELMRLEAPQLDALIAAFESGKLPTLTDFNKRVNQLRLSASRDSIVIGAAQVSADDEEEDEEPPFAQAGLYDEAEADEPGPMAEEEVYIEEVIEFFHVEGARMQVCTRDEAVWDGLFVLAAVDAHGKPYLKWGRPLKE